MGSPWNIMEVFILGQKQLNQHTYCSHYSHDEVFVQSCWWSLYDTCFLFVQRLIVWRCLKCFAMLLLIMHKACLSQDKINSWPLIKQTAVLVFWQERLLGYCKWSESSCHSLCTAEREIVPRPLFGHFTWFHIVSSRDSRVPCFGEAWKCLIRNKLNITTLCMDAQELLHTTLFGTFGWEAETDSTSRPPRLHIVFNLPELALQILCNELREAIDQHQVQLTDPTVDGRKSFECCVCSVYCYTFGPSQSAVSEHLKLLTDLPEMQRAAKIRQVRLVSPSKAMFCVEFDLKLRQGTGERMRKIAASIDHGIRR